jgi:hypothetical protein
MEMRTSPLPPPSMGEWTFEPQSKCDGFCIYYTNHLEQSENFAVPSNTEYPRSP